MTAEHPELLTVAEVCTITRLGKSSVHREINAGQFDVSRVGPKGGAIRVTRASVLAYLERRTVTNTAELESEPAPLTAAA